MQLTGGDAFAQQLLREGVRTIFGVPGVQLDWALDGIAKLGDAIQFYTTRHEQAASYMADGYARTTGKVGVCMVVPGPGLLNAMSGLATAYACSSPVLCIAGQIPSTAIGRGLGMLHEINNQSEILRSVTKWHARARAPEEIPGLVREAFHQLGSGRPQPVGLELPPDVLQASADIPLLDPANDQPGCIAPDARMLSEAAALLKGSRRPVIYVGWGSQAADAGAELRQLAELLQAPVIMSEHGRGSISDTHPLALTKLGGRAFLPHADVVLVIGSRFVAGNGQPMHTPPSAKVIYLNADADAFGEPRVPGLMLHGDARLGLLGLLDQLEGIASRLPCHDEVAKVRDWCAAQIAELEPGLAWVRALRNAIPEDGILVTELTQISYQSQIAYPVFGPRTFITPGYQGTLGYGFATGLGIAVGNPGRAVVSLAGDGGFGWTMQELATARKYGIGLVVVVFNDNAFGNVKRIQKVRFGGRLMGSDLVNPDFVQLGRAFGIDAVRAETPTALQGALQEMLANSGPALIEVPIGELSTPWHLIHDFVPAPRPAPANPLDELLTQL